MYFMAQSFYAYLVPAIVVGVLLTCQSLNPEYKTTLFFQYFQEKKQSYIRVNTVYSVTSGTLVCSGLLKQGEVSWTSWNPHF